MKRFFPKRPWSALLPALACLAGISLTGCDDLLDVNNPNNLTGEDLENSTAAPAIAFGARTAVGRAYSYILTQMAVATDETYWTGSRDAWGQLDRGFFLDLGNEFTDQAFPFVGEARWTADNAIDLLEGFDSKGELTNQMNLAEAYFSGALIYMAIGDTYDNFALSNRDEAAPAVGRSNMVSFYDTAIGYLDAAMPIVQGTEREPEFLAVRARAKHARAVWDLINPEGSVPSSPWVSAGADDAAAYVAAVGTENDQFYTFTFTPGTVISYVGYEINERVETSVTPEFLELADPVTGELDARAQALALNWTPGESDDLADLYYTSSREMHLIQAEAALANGNEEEAVMYINNVRALGGVAEYDPATSGLSVGDMLKHERRVNLFMQMRRLGDLYRYGDQLPEWDPSSDAVTMPGTFFPIAKIERDANQLIAAAD